jgi:hypothetical protein
VAICKAECHTQYTILPTDYAVHCTNFGRGVAPDHAKEALSLFDTKTVGTNVALVSTEFKDHHHSARQSAAFMATTTAWEDYLAQSAQSSAIPLNISGLLRRLEDPEGIYFADDEINVRITDIGDGESGLCNILPLPAESILSHGNFSRI